MGRSSPAHLEENQYSRRARMVPGIAFIASSAFSATSPSASISITTYPIRAEVCRYCAAMLTPCSAKIWLRSIRWAVFVDVHQATTTVQRQRHFRKFTADSVEPLSEYLISFPATSRPMFSCASCVEPPICGVRITLSNSHSGEVNGSRSGRFRREDVDSRPARCFVASVVAQSRDIYHRTARGVNQQRTRLHQGNLLRPSCFWWSVFRYVQTDHIAHIQQFRQVLHLSCVTERQFIFNIIEIDASPAIPPECNCVPIWP